MSHPVAQDVRFYLDGVDLSGDSNSVDLGLGTLVVPDGPCFGQTVVTNMPGPTRWSMGAAGLLSMADDGSDEVLHAKWNRAVSNLVMSPTGVDGDVAYFGRAFQSEFAGRPGRVGDAVRWTWGGAAAELPNSGKGGALVRGAILHTKASRAASGNGTAFQLGAVGAAQRLYAMLHVFSAPGTSLVVKIQSDDNAGMSSPTDRITFAAATTAITAELASVAGPITDTYWRAVWTITGAGPYVLAVAAGIL